jgi:hypothetical protein
MTGISALDPLGPHGSSRKASLNLLTPTSSLPFIAIWASFGRNAWPTAGRMHRIKEVEHPTTWSDPLVLWGRDYVYGHPLIQPNRLGYSDGRRVTPAPVELIRPME